ncbi:MAG: peptidylprolyl isomerase [Actinomycetota bacterium]|nr:peptidylprolyl isomerase [Actinomycetota bacterium]
MVFPFARQALVAATCVLALAASACGGEEKKSAEDVPADAIALIGETKVPKAEFDALMERAEKGYKAQKRKFPKVGTPEYQDLKTRAVAFLAQRYQFRKEARELGIDISAKEVDKKLAELKRQLFQGDEKKFQQALEQEGLTEEQLRLELRDQLLRERLHKEVTEGIKVSDEEIDRHYEKNKAQFTQPASRNVRHILVKQKAQADEVYAELRRGGDFAALAKRFSQDPGSKEQGGKLPVTKGSTVPPFDKTAFSLATGELSKPVKTQFGWHIIEALSPIKRERATPLKDVKSSIRQQLLEKKKNDALQKWLKQTQEKWERETVYAAGFAPPKPRTGTTQPATTPSG